jgi:hypothetical protein
MRGYLSPVVDRRSLRFQALVLSALVTVAGILAVLLSLTMTDRVSPTVTTGVQTNSASGGIIAARPLLDKPELLSLRSAYARHYDLGNGKRVAVVGAAPLNYQDAEGNWQPIKPEFQPKSVGWGIEQNTLRSAFADDSTAVELKSNGTTMRRPMKSSTSSGHAVHPSERSDASMMIVPSGGRHGQGRMGLAP